MTTTEFAIWDDGSVSSDPDVVAALRTELDQAGTDVVVLASPIMAAHHSLDIPWVGIIDDWGATKELPINRKAWALYGRSPIHGPMIVKNDLSMPIDPDFIAMIASPIEEWVDERVLVNMDRIIVRTIR